MLKPELCASVVVFPFFKPAINKSAKRGHPDKSKLTITIRQPGGRPYKVSRSRGEVDFRKSIRELNRRQFQVFLKCHTEDTLAALDHSGNNIFRWGKTGSSRSTFASREADWLRESRSMVRPCGVLSPRRQDPASGEDGGGLAHGTDPGEYAIAYGKTA
ncbi:hypothetical protein MMC07_005288 [Pseudocyphellaria aurata]|nr:hypothetical protein [Pseudocyphellaria aurata]